MGPARVEVRYNSEDELWYAYVRSIAEDAFFVAGRNAPHAGEELRIAFELPGREALECRARTTKRPPPAGKTGFYVSLDPTAAFLAFVARKQSALKEGRSLGTAGGARAHARYGTFLEVEFRNYPDLSIEYATNISKGGLFVRTPTPPALRSTVKLALKLPNGEVAETEAEVAHVVTVAEAATRGVVPGVGLKFPSTDTAFSKPIDALINEYQARRPRVLVAEPDGNVAQALKSGLGVAGLDVDVARDGTEAMNALLEGLFQYDLLLADLNMPGMDGRALVNRIRRVGGERDLRIVLWVDDDPAGYADLKGPNGANEILKKQPPSEELLGALLGLLGR